MLVLGRRKDEKIVIPGLGIEIVVVKHRAGVTYLGFDAPKDIEIHRQEIWDRIQAEGSAEG